MAFHPKLVHSLKIPTAQKIAGKYLGFQGGEFDQRPKYLLGFINPYGIFATITVTLSNGQLLKFGVFALGPFIPLTNDGVEFFCVKVDHVSWFILAWKQSSRGVLNQIFGQL